MSLFVIDASVAAKWVLPDRSEALLDEAEQLLARYARGHARLVVPDLFWAEFGNILWKAVRRGRCTQKAAATGLATMRKRGLPTIPSDTLVEAAFAIAAAFDRTVYDSLYIALAIDCQGQLVTADEKLANAVAAHFPVKWLGSL